ncbi:MAG: substrate-binding domain-containing protein [Proteobacteria bacterium]|nr:substrate-binding domain-containing protein [Pseudomonadota bacterium]
MLRNVLTGFGVALVAAAALVQPADARDQIRIVGSSTVYPFSTVVAEAFGRATDFATPVIESTGTGGGFALFCAGIGESFPDFSNASRAIKSSERELCASNGITDIVEIKIGYDGIVLANSRRSAQMDITRAQLWQALAREVPDANGNLVANPHTMWSEIDPSLPAVKIEVLGPPPTSGTRDAFVELVMDVGCEEVAAVEALDSDRRKQVCRTLREDGAFIEAGENDVLIVRKLEANPDAFGIFGFSFLDQNSDVVQGSRVEGAGATFDNVANGAYPVSRPLFFYAKTAHADLVPGFREFIREFTDERTWGEDGYLIDRGLIPMPDDERSRYRDDARSLSNNLM